MNVICACTRTTLCYSARRDVGVKRIILHNAWSSPTAGSCLEMSHFGRYRMHLPASALCLYLPPFTAMQIQSPLSMYDESSLLLVWKFHILAATECICRHVHFACICTFFTATVQLVRFPLHRCILHWDRNGSTGHIPPLRPRTLSKYDQGFFFTPIYRDRCILH